MTAYSMTPYNTFIAKSRYSRYLDDKGRREHWNETVARYFDFMEKHLAEKQKYTLTKELRNELEQAVVALDVVPSMRAVMTAGPALERQNVANWWCSDWNYKEATTQLKAYQEAMQKAIDFIEACAAQPAKAAKVNATKRTAKKK